MALDVLESVPRYHDWIVECFSPHLGGMAAEIGAGIGTIAERTLPLVDSLDLIEPSATRIGRLQDKFAAHENVRLFPQTFEGWLKDVKEAAYDSIMMVNVLEHIEDDATTLNEICKRLKPGGKFLIFVPALPMLYSPLDKLAGHYRRYTRPGLTEILNGAAFHVHDIRYMDILGFFPWWLLNVVLGKTEFVESAIQLYDFLGVPLTKLAESLIKPPFGKNLIAVAEKAAD